MTSPTAPAAATLITGIAELTTNDPEAGPGVLGTIQDAAVVLEAEKIAWVGPALRAPAADNCVDVAGRAVLPGWVDSHTHLVFAGDRAAEFSARMAGEAYSAGGMISTVTATRAASDDELLAAIRHRLAAMYAQGTTTVETKTGYGLTVEHEARSAQLARAAGVDEVTFLGAHVIPEEFDGSDAASRRAYVDLVCGDMLHAVKPHARFIDIFCEDGAFDGAETRRILRAGQAAGLQGTVHGNQLSFNEGAQAAVDCDAASVTHCTYLTADDIAALASSNTVATLLPVADLSTRQPAAPGRALLDAGATVALATNCNPGTSYTTSMQLVVALAVTQCHLSTPEAVWAATAGGAQALRRDEIGAIRPGMRADLQVLDAPSVDHIAYRVGGAGTFATWRAGERLHAH